MKTPIALILALCLAHFCQAQLGLTKEVIVTNKVKALHETYCFPGEDGSCINYYHEYDQRGNQLGSNLMRLSTRYYSVFNDLDQEIMMIWDHYGEQKNDTFFYQYDTLGERIAVKTPHGEQSDLITYDEKNRKIRTTSKEMVKDDVERQQVTSFSYTDFGAIQLKEKVITEISLDGEKRILRDRGSMEKYEYDGKQRLIKKISSSGGKKKRTSTYSYDDQDRVIEQRDFNWTVEPEDEEFGRRKETITRMAYDEQGRIIEIYNFMHDPCMSLNDHFQFTYQYAANGLLESGSAVSEDGKIKLHIGFVYEFWE